ncbi:MAG: hypothetical protein RIS35_1535 [Pseudomonadota bacterium]
MNASNQGKAVSPWYIIDDHRFGHDGLEIVLTNDFDSPNFAAYYGLQALCLPDHMQEAREDYRRLFELARGDAGQALRDRLGEFADVVAVAREPGEPEVVAAAAAVFFRWNDGRRTMSLIYMITAPGIRRRRYAARLWDGFRREMARRIDGAIGDARPFDLVTGDICDPFDPESAIPPTVASAGIDRPEGRLRWVGDSGARVLDLVYREPSEDHDWSTGIPYLFLVFPSGADDDPDAGLLRDQLERFLTISVLCGQDARNDPVARPQLEHLDALSRAGARVRSTPVADWLRARSSGARV